MIVRGGVAPLCVVGWRRRRKSARWGVPQMHIGGKTRARRTSNTYSMPLRVSRPSIVMLDVSKLSGWLNASALKNMLVMLVTLDVSRLSGWLNADAPCQVNTRRLLRHDIRAGTRGSVGGGKQRVQREPNWACEARHARSARRTSGTCP